MLDINQYATNCLQIQRNPSKNPSRLLLYLVLFGFITFDKLIRKVYKNNEGKNCPDIKIEIELHYLKQSGIGTRIDEQAYEAEQRVKKHSLIYVQLIYNKDGTAKQQGKDDLFNNLC